MPAEPAEAWERQFGESRQAFEAFASYRDLAGGRSIAAAAAKVRKSTRLLKGWSSKWRWQERVLGWEKLLDSQRRKKALEEATKEGEEERLALRSAFYKALEAVNAMVAGSLKGPQAVRALVAVIEARRLSRGEPTEIPGFPVPIDGSGEQSTPAARLRKLLETDPHARALADDLGYRLAGGDARAPGGDAQQEGVDPGEAPALAGPEGSLPAA